MCESQVKSGIEVCRQITIGSLEKPVIILTAFDWDIYLAKAHISGAAGFVVKRVETSELIKAIYLVSRGKSAWSEDQLRRVQQWKKQIGNGLSTLTARESEILGWVAAGRCNREIAKAFAVSENTMEKQVSSILGKLAVDSRHELISWAYSITSKYNLTDLVSQVLS